LYKNYGIIAIVLILGFEPIGVDKAQAKMTIISGEITQIDLGMWVPTGRRKAVLHVKTAKGNLYIEPVPNLQKLTQRYGGTRAMTV